MQNKKLTSKRYRKTQLKKLIREKEMATHSSIVAWKISWTKESGGLQYMGLQRVGHNWVANTYLLTYHLSKYLTSYSGQNPGSYL